MNRQTRAWLARYRLVRHLDTSENTPESVHLWLPAAHDDAHDDALRDATRDAARDAARDGQDGAFPFPLPLERMLCGVTIPVEEQREVADVAEVTLTEQCVPCIRALAALLSQERVSQESRGGSQR